MMEVRLLGTGSADGWPNPFCTCASCRIALAAGEIRGQTAALVDDVLLLDCGPEAPRAAARAGRDLAGVRHLLLTHGHPDHTGPAALLWRAWAGRQEPLDVVGPAAALATCRDWVGPSDPVRWRPVTAGARLDLGGYDVRVLPAAHGDDASGPAVLYDVTGPDGARLLYATDTGPLPAATLEAVEDAAYDLVLLEETFGDRPGPGAADHLDLTTFPVALAALRTRGAVTERTDVVAVHLSHRNPPTAELARRLAAWGARVVPDGTLVCLPSPAPSHGNDHAGLGILEAEARSLILHDRWRKQGARRVLVLGGARSGKSVEAERRLLAEPAVTYVATSGSRPDDPEWAARVAIHRARRPASWTTLESPDLAATLRAARGAVLVDCLTLWLTGVLDAAGAWERTVSARASVDAAVDELVDAWRATRAYVVAVSNEVGAGIVPASTSGRLFRDELGRLNARIAAESEEVVLMVAGQVVPLRQQSTDQQSTGGHPTGATR